MVGPAVTWRRDKTHTERESGWWGFAPARVVGRQHAYLDLRIVSHGLVLCAVTLPIDPVWEMLQSKEVLREASHGVARGKARARTRPDIVGVVSCRGLEGPGGSGERGVWFIAHQCACFAVERRQLLGLIAVLLAQTALIVQRVAGYLST